MEAIVVFKTQTGQKIQQNFEEICPYPLAKVDGLSKKDLRSAKQLTTIEHLMSLKERDNIFSRLGTTLKSFYYKLKKRLYITEKSLIRTIKEKALDARSIIDLIVRPFLKKVTLNGNSKFKEPEKLQTRRIHRSYSINAFS